MGSEPEDQAVNPAGKTRLRQTLGTFATGVTVITALHQPSKRPVGITINSFSSVSLQPPMVLWSIRRDSPSRTAFDVGAMHVIHVLREDQADVAQRFARSGENKFQGLAVTEDPHTGVSLLQDWAALIKCRTGSMISAGDHDIVLADVLDYDHTDATPLIFVQGRFGAPAMALSNSG